MLAQALSAGLSFAIKARGRGLSSHSAESIGSAEVVVARLRDIPERQLYASR